MYVCLNTLASDNHLQAAVSTRGVTQLLKMSEISTKNTFCLPLSRLRECKMKDTLKALRDNENCL